MIKKSKNSTIHKDQLMMFVNDKNVVDQYDQTQATKNDKKNKRMGFLVNPFSSLFTKHKNFN